MEMTRVNAKSNNSNAKTNGVKEKAKKIVRIQVSKTKKPFFFYLNLAKVSLSFILPLVNFQSQYSTQSTFELVYWQFCVFLIFFSFFISLSLEIGLTPLRIFFPYISSTKLLYEIGLSILCFFLMQKYIKQGNDVELSALGMGIIFLKPFCAFISPNPQFRPIDSAHY